MQLFIAKTLNVGEESEPFKLEGLCDMWIMGLTTGKIQLQVLFPGEGETYRVAPDGEFEADVMKNIVQAEHAVLAKLVGVGNNDGVYVRLAKSVRRE